MRQGVLKVGLQRREGAVGSGREGGDEGDGAGGGGEEEGAGLGLGLGWGGGEEGEGCGVVACVEGG